MYWINIAYATPVRKTESKTYCGVQYTPLFHKYSFKKVGTKAAFFAEMQEENSEDSQQNTV